MRNRQKGYRSCTPIKWCFCFINAHIFLLAGAWQDIHLLCGGVCQPQAEEHHAQRHFAAEDLPLGGRHRWICGCKYYYNFLSLLLHFCYQQFTKHHLIGYISYPFLFLSWESVYPLVSGCLVWFAFCAVYVVYVFVIHQVTPSGSLLYEFVAVSINYHSYYYCIFVINYRLRFVHLCGVLCVRVCVRMCWIH